MQPVKDEPVAYIGKMSYRGGDENGETEIRGTVSFGENTTGLMI